MSLFEELRRRNVFRVGIAYAVATWLLLQMVDVLAPIFELPDWAPKLILLILAVGFIPTVIFAWAFEMTPEGIKREADVNRSESITGVTAKKLDYVTIGMLAAAILIVAVDRFLPQGEQSSSVIPANAGIQDKHRESGNVSTAGETSVQGGASDQPKAPPPKSIAVLPFVNMSDDASNEYFSDGISEEILNALAKVKDLKVAGRTSSFAFKGQNQDLREIGAALNVSHILEGSVRKAGNRVRVTAQLIKVDDGYHIWSENYDRELDDIFAIQDEISANILQQLKAHLIGDEATTVARTDSQTYDLYLLAGQRIYERNQASLQMASNLLTQAIAIDPGYAPAYAQLGIATLLLADTNYGTLPNDIAGKQAKTYLDQALNLDPNQAEAMAGMGLYFFDNTLDHDTAILWLEKSLALNPNLVNANVWLSTLLAERGELRRSRSILEGTFARDPLHPPTFNNLAMAYSTLGEPEKALNMLGDLKRYLPGDAGLIASMGKAEILAGNWAESDRLLTQAVEREPLNWTDRVFLSVAAFGTSQYERVAEMGAEPLKAIALHRLGRTEEALILATDFVSKGNRPGFYMQILVENGRFDELISFLESGWESLEAYDKDFPARRGNGSYAMGYIANAYARQGNTPKFDEALAIHKSNLDKQISEGADNWQLDAARAYFEVLSGDLDSSLTLLEQVANQGGIPRFQMTGEWSVFAPLRGDPRFEAVLTQLTQHMNEERADLGLEPVSI